MIDLERAKEFLKDQFDDFGYSSWLEGWVCGYTDSDHRPVESMPCGALDLAHTELFGYLAELRKDNKKEEITISDEQLQQLAAMNKESGVSYNVLINSAIKEYFNNFITHLERLETFKLRKGGAEL